MEFSNLAWSTSHIAGGGLERIYSEISVGELKTIEDANYSKRVISGGMRMNAVILPKTSLSANFVDLNL